MITAFGGLLIQSYNSAFEGLDLFVRSIWATITPPYRVKDIFHQIHFVANQSIPIVVFCVTFAAVVTIIEASFHMKLVIQNDALVPGFAALLILRELGSVLAALLMTSRVGAGLAAEVGSMKVTEQVEALKILGIEPIRFLVVPRFVACVLGGIALACISNMVCLIGAMVVSVYKLGYSPGAFVSAIKQFVYFKDLIFAMIKGGVFGAVIPIVSCYYGFRCKTGAEGVGFATTNSVVTSSVIIIVLDFVLAWVFSHFY